MVSIMVSVVIVNSRYALRYARSTPTRSIYVVFSVDRMTLDVNWCSSTYVQIALSA